MSKFAMYVIDLENQTVTGTNSTEDIQALPEWPSEQYVIIHSTYGDWQLGNQEAKNIYQLETSEDTDDDEGDDE